MTALLTPAFVTRAPKLDDAPAVTALICASDEALLGKPDFELDDLLEDWRAPRFTLEKDAHIVVAEDGRVIGYETVWSIKDNGIISLDGYVHPEFMGQGIGTYLLHWGEARARERIAELPAGVVPCTQFNIFGHDEKSAALAETEGYSIVRRYWRMQIEMNGEPPAPVYPEGVQIRTFVAGQDEYETWQTVNAVFEEEWSFSPTTFDDWKQLKFSDPEFDPTLWFLAIAEGRIIGIALGNYRMNDGWLRTVGVRREWRRRGVAKALLHYSFGEFFRRGKTVVGLGVDSQNPTGATQVYENAGMHPVQTFKAYEKPLG